MKILIFLFAAFAASASPALRPHQVPGVFRCLADARWAGRSDWAGRYPAYYLLRASAEEAPPSISVEYFKMGNPLYKDVDAFLQPMRKGPRRERPVSLGARIIDGAKRTVWERAFSEPVRIRKDGSAAKRNVRERFTVIQRENDFFVMRLKAAEAEFESAAKEFDGFLESVKVIP